MIGNYIDDSLLIYKAYLHLNNILDSLVVL